jgi:hypothetical protein
LGSFGRVEIEVPRARLNTLDGKTTEWKSKALRAYQRRTLVADALIAGAYLAGTNTRRVRRALGSLFGGPHPGRHRRHHIYGHPSNPLSEVSECPKATEPHMP